MSDKAKEAMDQQIDDQTQQVTKEEELVDDEVLGTEEFDEAEASNEDEAQAAEGVEEKSSKSGKSFFKSSKTKELAAKDQKIEELSDRLMRNMAEFDNFRKRSEKEKALMYDMGVKSFIEKILPIVDNFQRGFGTITEKEKESAFAQGIELIYRQLMTALDEVGVKPIDAVGKEFDPNLHNAVMHGEDENLGENIVSDEFQKGYMYRDMVVRHSMVKVVN
ncbi:MAG TPA: nucleotide exchange factor GrpE [Lachnospiraceae bacterium]|nr:nucleotide exchange factor GrpE [Lachnospiraceae bacterium]